MTAGFFNDPSEQVVPMSGVERTHYAAMKALQRNFAVCSYRLHDCSRALAFLEAQRAAGERITFAALVVRAAGLTLARFPRLSWMARGWRIVRPSTADVGCSVATGSPVAPVVVVRDAGRKGLAEVNRELAELSARARETESAERAKIERLARLVPIRWLFRLIVQMIATRQRFLRHTVGNFQVSVLSNTEVDFGLTSMTGASTLLVGRIKDRPLAENGQVVVRPAAYFCLHFDHAVHGAREDAEFMDEFLRLLDHPEELR